jgi:hypothetical protein
VNNILRKRWIASDAAQLSKAEHVVLLVKIINKGRRHLDFKCARCTAVSKKQHVVGLIKSIYVTKRDAIQKSYVQDVRRNSPKPRQRIGLFTM